MGLSTEQAVAGPEYRSGRTIGLFAHLQRSALTTVVAFDGEIEDVNFGGTVLRRSCKETELKLFQTMELAHTCDPPAHSLAQTLRKFAFSVVLPPYLRVYSLIFQPWIHLACHSELWTLDSLLDRTVL